MSGGRLPARPFLLEGLPEKVGSDENGTKLSRYRAKTDCICIPMIGVSITRSVDGNMWSFSMPGAWNTG